MFGKNKDKQKKEEYKKIDSSKEEVPEENPMQEMVKETEQKAKEMFEVVREIPTQPIRQVKLEDGTLVNLITIEEALTKFINEEEE